MLVSTLGTLTRKWDPTYPWNSDSEVGPDRHGAKFLGLRPSVKASTERSWPWPHSRPSYLTESWDLGAWAGYRHLAAVS